MCIWDRIRLFEQSDVPFSRLLVAIREIYTETFGPQRDVESSTVLWVVQVKIGTGDEFFKIVYYHQVIVLNLAMEIRIIAAIESADCSRPHRAC